MYSEYQVTVELGATGAATRILPQEMIVYISAKLAILYLNIVEVHQKVWSSTASAKWFKPYVP